MNLKSSFADWVTGDGPGFPLAPILYLLSIIYGAVVSLRLTFYRSGILRTHKLACPVVSIGNITVGGSGKTPFAIYVAKTLKEMGLKPAILSRGYKRTTTGTAIVSDGKYVLLSADQAGDEPFLMASTLKDVPVVVDGDRVRGGKLACDRFSPDIIVLDDAFQHIRLSRDLDIVLVDSTRGFGNGRLLPRGILREPVSSLARADLIVAKSRGDASTMKNLDGTFGLRPVTLKNVFTGEESPLETLKETKAVSVSAIATPASFIKTLAECGSAPASALAYPDHYRYDASDVADLMHELKTTGAGAIITTEKDGVKLAALKDAFKGTPVLALKVEVAADKGLTDVLKQRLADLTGTTT